MKVKTKLAIALIIALFAVIMLFTTKVNAETVGIGVSTSDKITAESFENIPSTINVNLKESEFEQTPSIILNIIIDKLKEQNIDLKDITGEEDYEEFLENEPDSYILVDVAPKNDKDEYDIFDFLNYKANLVK